VTANTLVNPVSRRRFFIFLGAAAASPIIHHIIPEKLIFDMSVPVIATVPWRHYFQSVSIPIAEITDNYLMELGFKIPTRSTITGISWTIGDINKSDFGEPLANVWPH
jgi:hypothetical protein